MNQDQVPIEVSVWDFEIVSYQLSLDFGSYLDIRILGGDIINYPYRLLSKLMVLRLHNRSDSWVDTATGEKYILTFPNAKRLPEDWDWLIQKEDGKDFILREGVRGRDINLLASTVVVKESYSVKYSFFLIDHKEVEYYFNFL